MNPFAGTWTANVSKSQRHPNHLFQSAALTFDVSDDAISLTHSGVNAKGEAESGTQILYPDGKEHAVSEQMPDIVVTTEWLSPQILRSVARKDDTELGRGTYELSADGEELTATVAGTDAGGKAFDQVIVFDRKVD